jgi:hypothetical protein
MPYKDISEKRRKDREYWLRVKGKGPLPVSAALNRAIDVVKPLGIKVPPHGLKIAILTDAQVMPGVRLEHLGWYGTYIAEKKPDVILCMGDFGDFPSLSNFGRDQRDFHGHRWAKDLAAFHEGMQMFLAPIHAAMAADPTWKPRFVFCEGNHESHIERITQQYPFLEGTISREDLCLEEYGWEVFPFLQPVEIGGVAFCHYFPSGVMGRPISSAAEILRKLHMSAFAGHQQGREIAYARRADGGNLTAIISGSFYQHKYKFLSPFTNAHWRGTYFLHEVKDGQFDEMALSIDYLRRRYGG